MAGSKRSRKPASTACATLLSKRRSTGNARGTIRSCSAPSRCGRSISPHSMPQSRMKDCGRYPIPWTPSIAMGKRFIDISRPHRARSAPLIAPLSYQLKSMMQGVLARGTAHAISGLAPYVAGKTGTSDDENDAWFVGFTNDVTVSVWLGYDNATGKRRTLGGGATGGGVAV